MEMIKGELTLSLKRNLTLSAGEQQNSVYTDSGDFEKKGSAATICVVVIISLSVLVLCAFLSYRQLNKRKKQWRINLEKARRESIRQAVRLRLQELEHIPDSTPWLEQTKTRPSSVTFGDVVLITPSDKAMDPPGIDNRKHYGNDPQQQADQQPHHHSIYNTSKQRFHHHPHRPDYPKVNHGQHDPEPSLQCHLSVHEDRARDNKIRMYPNSDHHRLSIHKKFGPATEHDLKASMNSKQRFVNNSEHHRLAAHSIFEPAPGQVRETCVESTNIMMHNNGHHKLSAHKKFGPQTKQVREASMKSTNILIHNNEHHRLSSQQQIQPASKHVGQSPINSTNVFMRNNERYITSEKQLQPKSENAGQAPMNSTHITQRYARHNSNRDLVNDANLSDRYVPFNSQVVLDNGYSQRKRRSATIPM